MSKPTPAPTTHRICHLFAASLFLAVSHTAISKDIRIMGFGTRTCAEWQEWKATPNGEARAMALEWVTGFIAGHNVYARNGNDSANSVVADAKTLATLLDSYCQKSPGNRIVAGAIDISQSLGGAKVNLAPKGSATRPAKPNDPASPTDT